MKHTKDSREAYWWEDNGEPTPEPWHVEKPTCLDIQIVAKVYAGTQRRVDYLIANLDATDENETNAHRIVACVNAMEGMNPEAVGDVAEALKELLEGDRLVSYDRRPAGGWFCDFCDTRDSEGHTEECPVAKAQAALAKLETTE